MREVINMTVSSETLDRLSITLKKRKRVELIARYEAFGWQVAEEQDDRLYSDLVHLTLCRPHTVAHKDRLQYLQVCMEADVNLLAKKERRRHAGAIALGIVCGLACFLACACGLGLILAPNSIPLRVTGGLFVAAGLILAVCTVLAARRCVKRENLAFLKSEAELKQHLAALHREALSLTGQTPAQGDKAPPMDDHPTDDHPTDDRRREEKKEGEA